MKKLVLLAMAIAAVLFMSCNNRSVENRAKAKADSIRIADSLRAVEAELAQEAAAAAAALAADTAMVVDTLEATIGMTQE